MKTNELRKKFLSYFEKNGHKVLPGSSLIPINDPTLLFINAGMVQFKDIFTGREKRSAPRVATVQPCLRVSGKHNDLEQVGFTARHHTFFEMLGNFSFGDYFKREAIFFAWEFLTEVLKIPKEKLWATVYEEDGEAADIWLKEIKIDQKRFARCGEKDNFWAMGDTGPCGPCSEIFYDHGPDKKGDPPGGKVEGDRYVEIWNLVFMQFNRDEKGNLTPLPQPSVDTGMGLERLAAVMQGVHSNYKIDLFQDLIKTAAKLTNTKDLLNPSLKVIADHIRASSFLIIDGIVPSNEKRGYVLRRIIRRAIRHGHKLGIKKPFFYQLVKSLVKEMSDAYPKLKKQQKQIEKILLQEEEQFDRTLDQGLRIFEEVTSKIKNKIIPGEMVFKLYDTYGFPADLTQAIAKERGLSIDQKGFEQAMERQRQQSQAAGRFQAKDIQQLQLDQKTVFDGYEHNELKAKVIALFCDQQSVKILEAGEQGMVILDRTPFYAEAGGQVGDIGELKSKDNLFSVHDTQKISEAILQFGLLESGKLKIGDTVNAKVNDKIRQDTKLNHSATHLLHAALRKVLGDHVTQKGSLVDGERLRFDFSHFQALTKEECQQIETLVNAHIRQNHAVNTETMDLAKAKKQGAKALFGEKYGDKVRVVSMESFSKELCGGTHVDHTGNIGLFKILSETSIASGVRRIEAMTGENALAFVEGNLEILNDVCHLLKTHADNVVDQISQLIKERRELEKKIAKLQEKGARVKADDLFNQAEKINDVNVLATLVEGVDIKGLRHLMDQLKGRLKNAVIVLAVVEDDRAQIISGVTKDAVKQFHAGELMQFVAGKIGGKGGGRPDMAQGGGKAKNLSKALKAVSSWVESK